MKFTAVAALIACASAIKVEHRPSIDHIFYEQPVQWLEKVDKKVDGAIELAATKEQKLRDHEREEYNHDMKVIKKHLEELDAADALATQVLAQHKAANPTPPAAEE